MPNIHAVVICTSKFGCPLKLNKSKLKIEWLKMMWYIEIWNIIQSWKTKEIYTICDNVDGPHEKYK